MGIMETKEDKLEDWKIECEYDYDIILELKGHLKQAGLTLYNEGEIKSKDEIIDELIPIINKLPPELVGAIISNLSGNLAEDLTNSLKEASSVF